MRYIEKNNPCLEFDNYVIESGLQQYLEQYLLDKTVKNHPWKKFDDGPKENTQIKKNLTTHLHIEQKGLCVYCQQELNPNKKILSNYAHLEHLKPKERNQFPECTFEYKNLTVSCNGFNNNNYSLSKEFCGHNKGDQYSEDLFLDPTKILDIDSYFTYTIEGEVKPSKRLSDIQKDKVEYMINLLDLQNDILIAMRAESYSLFIEGNEAEQLEDLNPNVDFLPGFYSMLVQLG